MLVLLQMASKERLKSEQSTSQDSDEDNQGWIEESASIPVATQSSVIVWFDLHSAISNEKPLWCVFPASRGSSLHPSLWPVSWKHRFAPVLPCWHLTCHTALQWPSARLLVKWELNGTWNWLNIIIIMG